jgi:hypothetical protein
VVATFSGRGKSFAQKTEVLCRRTGDVEAEKVMIHFAIIIYYMQHTLKEAFIVVRCNMEMREGKVFSCVFFLEVVAVKMLLYTFVYPIFVTCDASCLPVIGIKLQDKRVSSFSNYFLLLCRTSTPDSSPAEKEGNVNSSIRKTQRSYVDAETQVCSSFNIVKLTICQARHTIS